MKPYSFRDVGFDFNVPGLIQKFMKGKNAIEAVFNSEHTLQDVAADGQAQYSLTADRSATIKFRFQKTSEMNKVFALAWGAQEESTDVVGNIQILIHDSYRGDQLSLINCAIKKFSDIKYEKEAGEMEWEVWAERMIPILGA